MSDRLTRQGQAFAGAARRMYTDRCNIVRRVSTKSGLDNVLSPQTIATDVPVKIKPSSAEEKQIAGATVGSTAFTVRMPAWDGDTPLALDAQCILEIAARDKVEAHALSVVAPLPSSGVKLEAVAVRQS